jgi:thioredoxin-like negative regulator of GroEL
MLTSDNIDKEINQEGMILVKFISDDKKSRDLSFVLDKLKLPVYTVDVDREPDLKEDYDIGLIPTTLVFVNGQKIHEIIGFKTKTTILSILTSNEIDFPYELKSGLM